MKRAHKPVKVLLACLTAAGVLTSFGTIASANTSAPGQFSMAFNLVDNGQGWDPALFSYKMYADGMGIFEGLVHMGPNGTPVPGIASSWSISPNGRVWTFRLRHAEFSNGDLVTAQDFAYGITRAVDPNTAPKEQGNSVVINDLPILNAQQVRLGTMPDSSLGVKALNSSTLQITLTGRDDNFLKDLLLPSSSFMVPVDQKIVEGLTAEDWTIPKDVVSDGPYMLQSYTPRSSAVLVPNPHYYGKVSLSKVIFHFFGLNPSELLDFQSGALQMALLQPTDVAAVENNSTLKSQLHWWPASSQYSLEVMNSLNTTLWHADVRKAFDEAVDKNVICTNVLQGAGAPAYEYYSPTWLDPWITKYALPYNPTQAKLLLAKAGYPGGKGFPTVVLYTAGVDPVAQAIQQMWEQTLGVNVELKSEEWGTFVTDFQKQLPSTQVGFYVWSTNAQYSSLMLPQSPDNWLNANTSAIRGYASPYGYIHWMKVNNDVSMNPAIANKLKDQYMWNSFPADVKQYLDLGIKAYQTGSKTLTEEFFGERAQRAYDIPVYTPEQPALLSSSVHGYQQDDFLDNLLPYWLNNITVSN